MFVPNKNLPGLKNVIYFIAFVFGEGVTIVDWIANMKLYVSNIVELNRDTIIGHSVNSGTADLLLHTVLACMWSWWRESDYTYSYVIFRYDV